MAVLRDAGLTLAEVDTFAVVTGPGSYTGLRVGIATIQGLALARHKLVTPVTAFDALAFVTRGAGGRADPRASDSEARPSTLLGTWIDGHRGEVFASLYAPDGVVIAPPTSLPPDRTLDAWAASLEGDARIQFAGEGAIRYADTIRAKLGERATILTATPTLAGAAGLIAAANPGRAVTPHALAPLYVGRSYAELARDRRPAANA
jgi:tRNA threonylcarbamoyladenosine biosynthesis protein TsaB